MVEWLVREEKEKFFYNLIMILTISFGTLVIYNDSRN